MPTERRGRGGGGELRRGKMKGDEGTAGVVARRWWWWWCGDDVLLGEGRWQMMVIGEKGKNGR